ncbi:hypothetical protein AB0C07_07075 [Actinoplanes missouriensis]
MSAKKLSRLAGLVLVLAAVFGGVAAGHAATEEPSAVRYTTLDYDWN